MTEPIVRAVNIDDRAVAARQSRDEAELLISDFQPFLRGMAARYSKQVIDAPYDELFSVIMIAFYESIQSYDVERGHFFPFARRVIQARVIDHNRSLSRNRGLTVSYDDDLSAADAAQSVYINDASEQIYDAERRQSLLAEEIEQFTAELDNWGITMDILARQSPKHKKLRETYRLIVTKVSEDPDIIQTILIKRYFPISAVAKLTGLPHKKLERARIFVLASLIIKLGDYELLSEYVVG